MTWRKLANGTARRSWLSPPGAAYPFALLFVIAPRGARAQAAPLEIAYDADPGCPTVMELLGKVRERAEGVDITPSMNPSAPIHIRLRASGEAFSGRLEMRRARGAYVRELLGPSCDETAWALAFVLAQALLPQGKSDEPEPAVDGSGVVERTRTVIPPRVVDRPRTPPTSDGAAVTWWAGVDGGVRKAPVPSWSFTQRGWVELRLPGRTGFVPSLGLGFVFSGPSSLTTNEGTAQVSWLAGRVWICPARIGVGPYLDIVPCIGTHAGVVWASGLPLTGSGEGRSSLSPWIDGLAELRLDLKLADSLSMQLGFEVIAILSRYDLVFDNPKTFVFRMPATTAAGSLGLALRIW